MTNRIDRASRGGRSFGVTFGTLSGLLAVWRWVHGQEWSAAVLAVAAVVLGSIAFFVPRWLEWPNRLWMQVARALGWVNSRVLLTLLFIFVLLYFTYGSALDAAHVLLAVPFALTGGVYLLWALGYNFSVAVWVGFIALFGTAVQTGVVMVIYLEDAVHRKREALGGALTREALREAVVEGALLRLRPKVMTVSTVVAGLLPIMWSTRVGAEVMKPLATPVLGGMVSSLVHVLIVTPVIFFWLRERRLGLQMETLPGAPQPLAPRRVLASGLIALTILAGSFTAWRVLGRGGGPHSSAGQDQTVVQTVHAGGLLGVREY